MDPTGYQNDLDFLGKALDLLRLQARLRIHERERQGLAVRDPILAMSEAEVDADALSAELADKLAEHATRLAFTPTPPALHQLQ